MTNLPRPEVDDMRALEDLVDVLKWSAERALLWAAWVANLTSEELIVWRRAGLRGSFLAALVGQTGAAVQNFLDGKGAFSQFTEGSRFHVYGLVQHRIGGRS